MLLEQRLAFFDRLFFVFVHRLDSDRFIQVLDSLGRVFLENVALRDVLQLLDERPVCRATLFSLNFWLVT